jgi:hypothetical protein
MTTQELFDCSIEDMGLNARTRGALKKVGVTTLDELEKALLGDQELPGLGPRAAEDIDRAIDALEAHIEADRRRRTAVVAILRARDDLAELLMNIADLAIDGAPEGRKLNGPVVREGVADMLRRTLRETHGALQVLAPELPDADFSGGEAVTA